jgi:hypothetical protein
VSRTKCGVKRIQRRVLPEIVLLFLLTENNYMAIQLCSRELVLTYQEVIQRRVCWDKINRWFWRVRTRPKLWVVLGFLFLRTLLREIYSLVGRMETQCSKPLLWSLGSTLLAQGPPKSRLALNTHSQTRISDIQQMLSNHPWASSVDVVLLLEGWDMGEKWAVEGKMYYCNEPLEPT